MPLSDPGVERRHYHTRDIQVRGYFRADGLWDIEGHMRDTKTYAFENSHRGEVAAGEPVHDMWLRITIDDTMLIHGAEAATESSPYDVCHAITPSYEQLIGLRIGPGFHRAVKQRLGGKSGCTHLTELLYPMATVCYQTAYASRNKARRDFGLPVEEEPQSRDKRPGHIDACHAMRADGPVVKEVWPQYYEGN
ncbi:MAG: DUF2889 domain-containing protein [Alphaproteobacteria bacterium]|nr:DUF2889 domain-containing protein [Pseudomonadota bacterium]